MAHLENLLGGAQELRLLVKQVYRVFKALSEIEHLFPGSAKSSGTKHTWYRG